jgi:hypothetical protein
MLTSRAAVIIHFEVRITLFSKLLLLRLQFANSFNSYFGQFRENLLTLIQTSVRLPQYAS